jgi:glutathione S-transferase
MLETADGKHLAQSWAILRYIGRSHGYYPEDPETAWKVDSTIDAVEDYLTSYFRLVFESNEEKKKQQHENFFKFLPNWLDAIEKRIKNNENPHFVVGSKRTIADFALGVVGFNLLLNEANPHYAETWPHIENREVLKAYATAFREDLKEYLEKRPQPRPY